MASCKGHRWHAAIYDLFSEQVDRQFARYRDCLCGTVEGDVLEIGVGTGANFRHYPQGIRLVGVEPDPYMLQRARRRAERLGVDAELLLRGAESLPFPDASFDAVVATLVFCTVSDVPAGLREVRRVLRPSGTFRFLEHVRAEGAWAAWIEDAITPVWRWFGAGCHPNRNTEAAIRDAGFAITKLKRLRMGIPPVRDYIVGVADPGK